MEKVDFFDLLLAALILDVWLIKTVDLVGSIVHGWDNQ